MSADLPPPNALPLASPSRRLGGFLIDSILYALVLLAVLTLTGADLEAIVTGAEQVPGPVLLIDLAVAGVYQVTLVALRGQTVGKMAVRTKVVDASSGSLLLPSWQSSFIRWGAPAALSTVPYVGLFVVVMYAWLLRDPRRQGLHDKLAQTLVVSVAR